MPTIVQFGAGNIGRSFVAQLFSAAGYEVVFVDVMDELVRELNARGQYRVIIKDTPPGEILVEHVRAVNGKDVMAVAEMLAEADIAATSVGPNALPYLYPAIARGLLLRYAHHGVKPLNIILAENLRHAPAIVRAGLAALLPADFPLDDMVGLVETSIGKMVPIMTAEHRHEDPLWVFAEAYNTLILDAVAFKGEIPQVPGLSPQQNMEAYVDRKIFIHNLGHAAVAYLGYLHDPAMIYIWQAVNVPAVRAAAAAAMGESARTLLASYPHEFTPEALDAHIADLLRRFGNEALGDTIFRVGRDLPRKLSRGDRIIGALRAGARHGFACPATAQVFNAALKFRATDEDGYLAPMDEKLINEALPLGLDTVLTDVCGLEMDDAADVRVAEQLRVGK